MSRLKEELDRAGISAAKLAEILGVHANSVYGWIDGKYEPNGRNLVQLSSILGCSPDYLLGLTDSRTKTH